MSVADLTGTTWYFNSSISSLLPAPATYYINFTSNGNSYTSIGWENLGKAGYIVNYNSTNVYSNETWFLSSEYRTITISGGTDATNASLISNIEGNATQVIISHDVTISYNNATIATMDASGTEVLETDGTICSDDITIEYVKPSAPAPSLQAKTNIAPTASSQTITPDVGYDGLSSVQINAISPTKTAQTYTPSTIDQTIQSGRWLSGAQTILGSPALVPGNIKDGVSIFNVTGSYTGTTPSGTISISSNGTVDVTNYALASVNVSGGTSSAWEYLGGMSEYSLSHSTTKTTTLNLSFSIAQPTDSHSVIAVLIRDRAGKRNGYFLGSDAFFTQATPKSSGKTITGCVQTFVVNSNGSYRSDTTTTFGASASTIYGFIPYRITIGGTAQEFKVRYNSTYSKTINGSFDIKVYALSYPTGIITP